MFLPTIKPEKDTTLYAMWGSTVTFDTSAYKGVIAPQKIIGYVGSDKPQDNYIATAPDHVDGIQVVTSFTAPTPETNMTGFIGWFNQKAGGEKIFDGNQNVSPFPKNSLTVYARYDNSVKVTFKENGGDSVPGTTTYLRGETVTEVATRKVKNNIGYIFLGWNEDPDYAADKPFVYTIPDSERHPEGELILYAIWGVDENPRNTKFSLLINRDKLPVPPEKQTGISAGDFTSGAVPNGSTSEDIWKTVNVLIEDNVWEETGNQNPLQFPGYRTIVMTLMGTAIKTRRSMCLLPAPDLTGSRGKAEL